MPEWYESFFTSLVVRGPGAVVGIGHRSEPVCYRRMRLVVADLARASSRVVAVGYDAGGPIAFSNDGLRIAYVLDGAPRLRNVD